MRRTAALLAALTACGGADRLTQPSDMTIEVGKPFPAVVLPSLADGRPASIADFRGKKTLLHVFASW